MTSVAFQNISLGIPSLQPCGSTITINQTFRWHLSTNSYDTRAIRITGGNGNNNEPFAPPHTTNNSSPPQPSDRNIQYTPREIDIFIREAMMKSAKRKKTPGCSSTAYVAPAVRSPLNGPLVKLGSSENPDLRLQGISNENCPWGRLYLEPIPNAKYVTYGLHAEKICHAALMAYKARDLRRYCEKNDCTHPGITEYFAVEPYDAVQTTRWALYYSEVALDPNGTLKPFFWHALMAFDRWGVDGETVAQMNRRWGDWVDETVKEYYQVEQLAREEQARYTAPVTYPNLQPRSPGLEYISEESRPEHNIAKCVVELGKSGSIDYGIVVSSLGSCLCIFGGLFFNVSEGFTRSIQMRRVDAGFCLGVFFMVVSFSLTTSLGVLLVALYIMCLIVGSSSTRR